MNEAEQRREHVLTILKKIHDVRFDVEMLALRLHDDELFKSAEALTELLPIIGKKL